MIELKYNQNNNAKGTLILGFFDCVHVGHISLISEAKKYSNNVFAFTFSNDISAYLNKKNSYIYSYAERLKRLHDEGVSGILTATFSKEFMSLSKDVFLNGLINSMDIERIVVGEDYTFGSHASGDVDYLKQYMATKNIEVVIVPLLETFGHKASTTYVKELLLNGEIEKANIILKEPYHIIGTVVHGKQNGRTINFPTANIELEENRTRVKEGVYGGYCTVDGKRYKAIINAGARPTLNSYHYNIETNIIDFDGDIYGKEITVEFIYKIREVRKFNSLIELKEQLQRDILTIERLS